MAMLLFRRRDTRAVALAAGVFAAAAVLGWPGTRPAWPWRHALAAAAGVLTVSGVVFFRRSLPADITIHRVPVAEAVRSVAAVTQGPATVFVQFEPDWLRRHRLDVTVDGSLAAQLRPGEAVLVALPPSLCAVSFNMGSYRFASAEQINGIPGTSTGFRIRLVSSRPFVIDMTRCTPSIAAIQAGRIRLVRPA